MDSREASLRPMHPQHVQSLFAVHAALPKYDTLRQLSMADLKGAFNSLDVEVTSLFVANEKRGHEKALAKIGYKFVSKTGWGYFGDKEYQFVFPDKISLEGASTMDDSTPVIKMPKETLKQIVDYLDPTDEWGRLAMALTCKKFAIVSKLSKVLKTAVNTGREKLDLIPSGSKHCSGCGKVQSVSRPYWEGHSNLLQAQWDTLPLGETQAPWNPRYNQMIRSWREGTGNVFSRFLSPGSWCVACQAQQRWEAWQSSQLTNSSCDLQNKMVKVVVMEKMLNERGENVSWGKPRST